MSDTKYTALILGATGLVGSNVLDLLLKDNKYGRIYTVSRRKIAIEHDKLIQIISEIDDIEKHVKNINTAEDMGDVNIFYMFFNKSFAFRQ